MATETKRAAGATKATAKTEAKAERTPGGLAIPDEKRLPKSAKAKAPKKGKAAVSAIEQAAADKLKEAKKKEAEAARAQKKAEAEKERTRKEAERAVTVQATSKELTPIAKEINVRLAKAEEIDVKADDHRLAAALKLEEARKICERAGVVSFKKWCEENVKGKSYETIRKLVTVAQAPEPAEALKDMREGNRIANQKARENQKKISKPSLALPAANKSSTNTAWNQAEEAVARLDDKGALSIAENTAAQLGHRLVPEAELKQLRERAKVAPKPEAGATYEDVKAAFDGLSARDKMTLLKYAAAQVGATVTLPDFDGGGAGEMPDFLKRDKK